MDQETRWTCGRAFCCRRAIKTWNSNSLLPENYSDDDILIGNKEGTKVGFIQVKACHPDRSSSFILRETDEKWGLATDNAYCVMVWLGRTSTNEPPRYWIALKRELGQ